MICGYRLNWYQHIHILQVPNPLNLFANTLKSYHNYIYNILKMNTQNHSQLSGNYNNNSNNLNISLY